MKTTWKEIAPVPTSQEFLDIVLSRTQRRLPTQIRSGFAITRIRSFYIRKVKYTAETFSEKLQAILDGFPRLNDIHPFHKDLLNTLYDADHFRIALGQCNTAKGLIETVSRDYIRLLKYGNSLFQCKQLKRAALGRMATICKRLKDPLLYLDQVRQHLGRLPAIDPNTRTLLICGYPNVGKSSFLKNISRADVDVQPYAFTTKSLFVGHFDYKMLRFQAIDTPGILDHPLEEMNTIEMQSITAIAHLRSAILYFMDLSEQCGYSVHAQMALFQSIKPLFANKLVFVVINKIDVMKPEDLDEETAAKLKELTLSGNVEILQLSCATTEGLMNVRNAVCDRLIAERNAAKLKAGTNSQGEVTGRLGDVLKRIHVAQPLGGIVREAYIPDAVKNRMKYDKSDPNRPKLMRDVEEENGGAGVFNINLKDQYMLENDEWKQDRIPETFNGQNVYDFIDPDIDSKLAALEEEEERLQAEGYYDGEEELEDAEESDLKYKAELIREKRALIRNENKARKSLKNRAVIPRNKKSIQLNAMDSKLQAAGYDTNTLMERARSISRAPRTRTRADSTPGGEDGDAMDVDRTDQQRLRSKSRPASRAPSSNRREESLGGEAGRTKAERMAKLGQKRNNQHARQGEADRHTTASLSKWLLAGKRGMGTTRSR
ncbi:Nucleolar GTP-binding protein 1 [Oleoguttula sp. CCFEE 5521]